MTTTSDEQEGNYRFPPEEFPEDEEIWSEEQEGDDGVPTQSMPDDKDIPADEQEGDNRMPPQEMSDNDDFPFEEQEGVEDIPPKFQIRYSEICSFQEIGEIILFRKTKYKISISVGLMANKMHTVNCFFDKGAEPNLSGKDFLDAR